jgi:hypothetical protein
MHAMMLIQGNKVLKKTLFVVTDIEVPIGPLHRDYVVDAGVDSNQQTLLFAFDMIGQHAGRMPGKMAIMKARSEYDGKRCLMTVIAPSFSNRASDGYGVRPSDSHRSV